MQEVHFKCKMEALFVYKYEMHCHTSEVSKCGKISGADLVDFYKSVGYSGIVITDHFLNGNTTVPPKLPWEERVNLYFEGYESARKRGEEIGVSVFFGWEGSYYTGTDFITYGLDKEWLIEHKYCDLLPVKQYLELARSSGGYVVQAHPFREADYIDMIRLVPRDVDAIETVNANRTDFENHMAEYYADSYGLIKSCGSDNHIGKQARIAALELDFKAKSIDEIISAIKENKHKISLYNLE